MNDIKSKKQTILNWNLNRDNQDNLKMVIALAGFDVRDVTDESEAINLVELAARTGEKIVCFMVRLANTTLSNFDFLKTMENVGFSLPILLVLPQSMKMTIRMIQDQISEKLNVHFCYENSTIDALSILETLKRR